MTEAKARVSPREFLRRRRPEYFSDTPRADRPRLDRAILEYHLGSLTSRSQELMFEEFARALCRLVVAPNLMPHTGPSGGGDGKVDAETFPLADSLTLSWTVADAPSAGTDRWAFAFSAKAAWKTKLRADLAKVGATQRGYKRAYFVSNQFIRAKEVSALQDELSRKFGFEVWIFDRNWILDQVFQGHHEDLAVKGLGIEITLDPVSRLGPTDASRASRLAEVDEQVTQAVERELVGPATVELAIESATLARALERSRAEVDGRFDRAARLARRRGLPHHVAMVHYEQALTAYWWYEDGPAFAKTAVEHGEAIGPVASPSDIRRLVTIFYLARTGMRDTWAAGPDWLEARRAQLTAAIDRASADDTAPSAQLAAKVTAALLDVFDDGTREDALLRLTELVDHAEGLIGFNFEELAAEVAELGALVPSTSAFEALHGRIVTEVQRRAGDEAAGKLHAGRAIQFYKSQRYPSAIAAASRALPHSGSLEARGTMLRALEIIAESFLQMGLPWAARAAWLVAFALAGSPNSVEAADLPRLLQILDRLRGVELHLGRLPQSLWVHRTYEIVQRPTAVDRPDIHDELGRWDVAYEAGLAHALMNVSPSQLTRIGALPDVLKNQNLNVAAASVFLVLGYEEEMMPLLEPYELTPETLKTLGELPEGPELDLEAISPKAKGSLRTRVLGVEILAEHDGGSPAIEIAESCLGAIESLLATGASHGIHGLTPSLTLSVRRGNFTPPPFRVASTSRERGPRIEIAYGQLDATRLTRVDRDAVLEGMREVLINVITLAFRLPDGKATLDALLGDERGFDRSLNFGLSLTVAGDLMGSTNVAGLAPLTDGSEQVYAPKLEGSRAPSSERQHRRVRIDGPVDMATLPHDRMLLADGVIDPHLWDSAGWRGIFFVFRPGFPPVLALGFVNQSAAEKIWKSWSETKDLRNDLQISLVTDVNPDRPWDYKVLVAPNWDRHAAIDRRFQVVMDMVRIHEMNTESDTNLRTFARSLASERTAHLGVALIPPGDIDLSNVKLIGSVPFPNIAVRSATQLGSEDWEVMFVGEIPIENVSRRRIDAAASL